MINTKLLKNKIKQSGLKRSKIIEKLGISYPCLIYKIEGIRKFKNVEIEKLCELLNIDENVKNEIFFVFNVRK